MAVKKWRLHEHFLYGVQSERHVPNQQLVMVMEQPQDGCDRCKHLQKSVANRHKAASIDA